jgi:hypothetical protein
MTPFRNLLSDRTGVSSLEFALVLPLLILFLFGIIDAGRFMWEYNEAEKATQMGARVAAVTDLVPSGLYTYSFAVSDGVTQGDPVPTANFDKATCDDSGACTCDGGGVCDDIAYDADAFNRIVDRMSSIYPGIGRGDVEVEYKNVGLGYSGDPNGPDVAPLITVRLRDLTFHPISCLLFGCTISMPDFRAALTAEDVNGTVSN